LIFRGRGVDETDPLDRARGLEQVDRALDVHASVEGRVGDRAAHVDLGGEVEDGVGAQTLEQARDGVFLEGQEPVEASAGSYAYVPAGLPHAFRVTSETAGVLNYTTPLHEQFFLAVADPAPSFELPPEGPPDIERLEAAAQRFGVEILGPPPGASN
jgi:hypothetical protein